MLLVVGAGENRSQTYDPRWAIGFRQVQRRQLRFIVGLISYCNEDVELRAPHVSSGTGIEIFALIITVSGSQYEPIRQLAKYPYHIKT